MLWLPCKHGLSNKIRNRADFVTGIHDQRYPGKKIITDPG